MRIATIINSFIQVLFIVIVFTVIFVHPKEKSYLSPQVLGTMAEANACNTDINKSGITDELDYAEVKLQFLKPRHGKEVDINKDNIVDISDYAYIYGDFHSLCRN